MSVKMNNADTEQQNIGEIFRQQREALKLTLEDVSQQIALRPSILQHIENNEFIHKSIPPIFMKGYVRSYAKFLKISDEVWAPCQFGENLKNDLNKNERNTKAVNQYSSHTRWVGWLSLLVIFAVSGMTALWWWESYQTSNSEREHLVQNYKDSNAESEQDQVAQVGAIAQPIVANLEPAPVATAEPVSTPTITLNNPLTTDNAVAESPVVINPQHNQLSANTLLQSELEDKTENQSQQSAVQNSEVLANADLRIEVLGDCWISVKDKQGKVLAQKEYKQGDVLSFEQGQPYSLIIGAPSNVNITYKGEAYPLKVDGRVAKFKLD